MMRRSRCSDVISLWPQRILPIRRCFHISPPLLPRKDDNNNIHSTTIQRTLVLISIIAFIRYYRRIPKERVTVDGNQNQIVRRVDNIGVLKKTDHFYLSHLAL